MFRDFAEQLRGIARGLRFDPRRALSYSPWPMGLIALPSGWTESWRTSPGRKRNGGERRRAGPAM